MESGSQEVKESESLQSYPEMPQIYPMITDSVRVDRRRVYDDEDRQKDRQTDRQTDKHNDICKS